MSVLHTFFWNSYTIGLLLIIAFLFHVKTRFIVFRKLGHALIQLRKTVFTNQKTTNQIQILSTSLGAVMGIGNIVGVATALLSGGAGSIFWMVVSSFVISSLKYVEIYLAMLLRKRDDSGYFGGSHVYMEQGLGSKKMAYLYLVLLLIVALTMGNVIVSNTLVSLIHEIYGIPVMICGIGLTFLIAVGLFKGYKGAMLLNSYLVPYMIILYIAICIGIIMFNPSLFVDSLKVIVRDAFAMQSVLGGGMGTAMKYGVARGIFSNEAGMGSCTMVHARSTNSAHDEAMLGVIEVILDSVVMCFLSGIVLVMSGIPYSLQNAILFLFAGFDKFLGGWGIPFVFLSLFFFGISSVLGWYVFGSECVAYLKKGKLAQILYSLLFLLFIFLGSGSNLLYIFELSDVLNALVIIVNVFACILLSSLVKK